MSVLLGIDTGGTYTDAVLFDEARGVIAAAKALTTRHDLAVGIGEATSAVLASSGIAPGDVALVSVSTTLATNALVEGQGGRIALVLIGFEADALDRAGLRDALAGDPCLLVGGGHDAQGRPAAALDLDGFERDLAAMEGEVGAFAVASLFAVRNPEHEIAMRDRIRALTGCPVTCSHELSSRLDGPRRALTCTLNARLVSLLAHLVDAAQSSFAALGIEAPLMVVRGDGALVSAAVAREKPIETILSGPAASLVGAAWLTGAGDAVVSDIGGTTTDVAILRGGAPALDAEGATVGGHRTMVEAVAMHTTGLGGDSEVHVVGDGLATRLRLGPRRAIPVSLFARDHGELVRSTLDRQLGETRPGELAGRFARAVPRASAHLAALSRGERELLDALADGPRALDRLIRMQSRIGALDRLVGRGLVQIAAATPSDAAHVLGLHDAWDAGAAERALALLARNRDAYGRAIAPDARAMSEWIVDTLVETSAAFVLDVACRADGHGFGDLASWMLAASRADAPGALVRFALHVGVPVVGLGASAPTYYPRVAARLGTEAVVPEHAGVANAIGAVVGRVRVAREGTLTVPEEGRYRVFTGAAPAEFTSLDAAVAHARGRLEADAREAAVRAGADAIEWRFERVDTTATVEGRETLVESRLTVIASGRPRFAKAG